VIFGPEPPTLASRVLPQPRRPAAYRSDDYEQGYDAGFLAGMQAYESGVRWTPINVDEEPE
jgi:hypothetical protein